MATANVVYVRGGGPQKARNKKTWRRGNVSSIMTPAQHRAVAAASLPPVVEAPEEIPEAILPEPEVIEAPGLEIDIAEEILEEKKEEPAVEIVATEENPVAPKRRRKKRTSKATNTQGSSSE